MFIIIDTRTWKKIPIRVKYTIYVHIHNKIYNIGVLLI